MYLPQSERFPSLSPSLPPAVQVAAGGSVPSGEYPDLPDSTPEGGRIDPDLMAAYVDAEVVGRHFHRGSGDRHFVSVPTYPKFEGMTLQVKGEGEGKEGGLSPAARAGVAVVLVMVALQVVCCMPGVVCIPYVRT